MMTTGIEINGRQGVSVSSVARVQPPDGKGAVWEYPVEHRVACATCEWAYGTRKPRLTLAKGLTVTVAFSTTDVAEALDWVSRHQFYDRAHLRAWVALKKREEALAVTAG